MSPSNTQTKRLWNSVLWVTRSNRGFFNLLSPAPLQVFHCALLQWNISDFQKTHSTLRFHFAPLTYSSLEWTGSSNAKSQYCSTNHIRWPKLVLGSWQIKTFPLAFFVKAGRRGRIRMSSSHSIMKFNTGDEQSLELQQCTITTRTSCLSPSLNIRSYAIP